MIIVDTGFWLALANKNDEFHIPAVNLFYSLQDEQFITTWCVMTETCYLLQIGLEFMHRRDLLEKLA